MTRAEFDAEMAEILSFYQKPRDKEGIEDLKRYMDALFGSICEIKGYVFPAVCREVKKTLPRGQKPMPSQFWAVHKALTQEAARHRSEPVERPTPTKLHMEEEFQRLLASVTPSGAKWILGMVDAKKVSYPDWVIEELLKIEAKAPTVTATPNPLQATIDKVQP